MKRIALIATLAACSGTIGHNGAVNLRYAGIVPIVGGALLIGESPIAGDGMNAHATEAGVTIALVGLAAIAVSLAIDPQGSK